MALVNMCKIAAARRRYRLFPRPAIRYGPVGSGQTGIAT